MKILQINSVYGYGSTGRIVESIHKTCIKKGIDSYVIFSRLGAINSAERKVEETDKIIRIYNDKEFKEHVLKAVLLDKHGLYSTKSTYEIIDKIKDINPDIIHLHNIHGFYLNYEILFDFLKIFNKKIIWTLHDCWAFTGFCSHYAYNECNEWKTGCTNCKYINVYPYRILSNSKDNYIRKNKAFNINNLTLVTPSKWLEKQLSKSFLKNISSVVINNTIDTNKFKYIESNYIREKYNLNNKKIALAIASPFTKQKGFDEIIKLSKIIDHSWIIVMIGLSDKQINMLPKNIIGIKRTEDIDELIKYYCSSDVLLNLTLEDTYPTVNLEAMACRLPIITYNTGGSTEIVESYGKIVDKYDIEEVNKEINKITLTKKKVLLKNDMVDNYIKLYKDVIND